jgi:hypothetical protein
VRADIRTEQVHGNSHLPQGCRRTPGGRQPGRRSRGSYRYANLSRYAASSISCHCSEATRLPVLSRGSVIKLLNESCQCRSTT